MFSVHDAPGRRVTRGDIPHRVRGALRIGAPFGVGVYIHWTFWLLILFLALERNLGGLAIRQTFDILLLAFSVFACVLLHELGHALMARRFGVVTRDIVLLPIGGMARMLNLPQRPSHELLIAIAGPLVNVAIAALLLMLLTAFWLAIPEQISLTSGFLPSLLAVNVVLVVFNMIPAFPMDGGRVLRAVLSMRLGFRRATEIAAGVGRVMAVIFFVIAVLTGQIVLGLIAAFVFFAGGAEVRAARGRGVSQFTRPLTWAGKQPGTDF